MDYFLIPRWHNLLQLFFFNFFESFWQKLKLSGTRLKLILKVSDVLTKIRGLLDWHC
jgi:hypothetical protein